MNQPTESTVSAADQRSRTPLDRCGGGLHMDTAIRALGTAEHPSPLAGRFTSKDAFIRDEQRVLRDPVFNGTVAAPTSFEIAGPRDYLHFSPRYVRSALVTCGGLCPGLNNVIRSIVMTSYYQYGSKDLIGIPYGYRGLDPINGHGFVSLCPDLVENIHREGGTILGSSRGGTDDMEKLVAYLVNTLKVSILYAIGGDGTLRGAIAISEIASSMGKDLAVIGIPKTIDNDINNIQKSFGFETAFSKAVESISTAHVEAKGASNGIGLVKLMGRHSGFIAANAALAMNDVNFVLVPEARFDLDGPNGFLAHLERRIVTRKHAVVCVAEGAGQDLLASAGGEAGRDASGNDKLGDIGLFLKDRILEYFKARGMEISLKYIDPSYNIRCTAANPNDAVYCGILGQHAVHAAMAGKTDMVIGLWNNVYIHLPMALAVAERKVIDPDSRFWHSVLEATGQPVSMTNNA